MGTLLVLRLLCAFHDGQLTALDEAIDKGQRRPDALVQAHSCAGLFGGYSAYGQTICTFLFPLDRAVRWTARLREARLDFPEWRHKVVFAASFNLGKLVLLDCKDGSISMCSPSDADCTPAQPAAAPGGMDGAAAAGGLLGWLEEYCRRLTTGVYAMAPIIPEQPERLGVSLMPVRRGAWPLDSRRPLRTARHRPQPAGATPSGDEGGEKEGPELATWRPSVPKLHHRRPRERESESERARESRPPPAARTACGKERITGAGAGASRLSRARP